MINLWKLITIRPVHNIGSGVNEPSFRNKTFGVIVFHLQKSLHLSNQYCVQISLRERSKGLLRYGSVRNYGTGRLDFGKYDTELRREFLEKVRYRTEIRYHIFRTVFQ